MPSATSVVNPPISPRELARYNFQPHHLDQYHFARDEITGGLYAFDELGPIVIDDDGDTCRIDPDRIAGYHHAAQQARTQTGGTARGSLFPPRGKTQKGVQITE